MKYKKILTLVVAGILFWAIFGAVIAYAIPSEIPEPNILPKNNLTFTPNIRIPGTVFDGSKIVVDGDLIGKYVVAVYTYGAGFAGIVAMFMLVLAGWKWLMAAGNSQKIASAKEMINGVLVGLALLFGGQLLLSQISTNLVIFDTLTLPAVTSIPEDGVQCKRIFSQIPQDADCGNSFTTSSAVYTANEITCIDTRCDDNKICVRTDRNTTLCPDSLSYTGSGITCSCISTVCSEMDFGYDVNSPTLCQAYPTPELCDQNHCFGEATKHDSDPVGGAAVCYYDNDSCKSLYDKNCNTSDDCQLASNPDTREWCCGDILGRNKCRPIGGDWGIDADKCKD